MNHHEAIRLFTKVSRDYPASVTAQAAALALETKSNRQIPKLLRSMRYDNDAIEIIAKTAEAAHGATDNSEAPDFVNRDILRGILDSEIIWIDRMERLRPSYITEILKRYGTFDDEETYEAYVEARYFPQK